MKHFQILVKTDFLRQVKFSQMSLGKSYRHWETDGGDSESRACCEGGHAVSPEQEVASLFPSCLGRGGDRTPWRRRINIG